MKEGGVLADRISILGRVGKTMEWSDFIELETQVHQRSLQTIPHKVFRIVCRRHRSFLYILRGENCNNPFATDQDFGKHGRFNTDIN